MTGRPSDPEPSRGNEGDEVLDRLRRQVDDLDTEELLRTIGICPSCRREFSDVGAVAFYSGRNGVVSHELYAERRLRAA